MLKAGAATDSTESQASAAQTTPGEGAAAEQASTKQPLTWQQRIVKWGARAVKLVVMYELLLFGLQQARYARNLGRGRRWGPASSDELDDSTSSSSDDPQEEGRPGRGRGGKVRRGVRSEEDEGGSGSEIAELMVDYLKGDADLEDLQGLSREEMARGLQKVHKEDLERLGLGDARQELLDALGHTSRRLLGSNRSEGSSGAAGGSSGLTSGQRMKLRLGARGARARDDEEGQGQDK